MFSVGEPNGALVLKCFTGWSPLMMHSHGAERIYGVYDFSGAQMG